jgi:plasmid stabilization system protein ParE
MSVVKILDEALEDLRNIVAYIASENPSGEEGLGGQFAR